MIAVIRTRMNPQILAAVVTIAVLSGTASKAEACDENGPLCPCAWSDDAVPVYVNSATMSAYLLPARSSAAWERIVQTVLNIFRENSGIALNLYYAGTTTQTRINGAIVVVGSQDCSNYLGLESTNFNLLNPGSISSSRITLYRKTGDTTAGTCQDNYWDPRLLPQGGSPAIPNTADPTNILVHEFGHAIGAKHPDNYCNITNASVMQSAVPIWARHFTRYDKTFFQSKYGTQRPLGFSSTYNGTQFGVLTPWPSSNGQTFFPLPGSASVPAGPGAPELAWGFGSLNLSGLVAMRQFPTGAWQSDLYDGNEPHYSKAAAAYGGSGKRRVFYFYEPTGTASKNDRKKLVYRERSAGAWGAVVDVLVNNNIVQSRRDGVAAAFDWATGNYIVLYNDDDEDVSQNPICDPACNRIQVVTLPGPNSALSSNQRTLLGHHSFSTPTVACHRTSTAPDRCLIAFSTSQASPWLQWIEGGPSSAGIWQSSGDRSQTSIELDLSPTVSFSTADGRFYLGTQKRYGTTTQYAIHRKTYSTGAFFSLITQVSSTSQKFSSVTMSSNSSGLLRYHLFKYQE
ncbi:MAG: hypothetical protein KBG28_18600 [Kofleriaceae bacterium]|nr:hypothetical protein [Kofleriaceae bacterium]MBP6836797.1 hypothetical protein [Kofleriaceae bacterium]MBP9205992.1 hypothetical protein [Kofleriaceae bacterium]